MGTESETLQLDMIVTGLDDLASLVAAQDKASSSTDRLRDAQGKFVSASGSSGGKTIKQQSQDIYDFADAYDVLGKEMDGVFTSAAKVGPSLADIANTRIPTGPANEIEKAAGALGKVEVASEKGKSKVAGLGQSLLQTGRVAQDFAQGGLGGIINNIEGLTTALGLGMGAAGALTVLGTAFLVFKPQIKEFVESFKLEGIREFFLGIDEYSSRLDTLRARIKELEDKPHKLAVDVTELEAAQGVVENIKRALSEVDKLRKGQAHYESESGKAIAEQIAEAPGGSQAVDQTLRNVLGPEVAAQATAPIVAEMNALKAKIADDLKAAANLDAAGQSGAAARLRGEAETKQKQLGQLDDKRIAAANDAYLPKGAIDQRVGEVLDTAKTGAGVPQAEAQRMLAEALEKGGMGGLGRGVRASSPEQLLANDQADDDLETSIEAQKAGIKRRDAATKARAEAEKAAQAKKKADGAPMDDAVRVFKGEQEAAKAKRKADGAPMDDAVRVFKGEREAKREAMKGAAAQQREALATNINANSNFTPDQSRQIAAKAIHMAKMNGDLSSSLVMAVSEMEATIMHLAGRFEQQQQHITGIRGNNRQVNRQLQQNRATFLNSGGP